MGSALVGRVAVAIVIAMACGACGGAGRGGASGGPGALPSPPPYVDARTAPSGAPVNGAPPQAADLPTTPTAPGGPPQASNGSNGPFAGPMAPIRPSAMAAELEAIGLDPRNLPPLAKLDPPKLRAVMKTFTKALGAQCLDCHASFEAMDAPTPNKAIAAKMWDAFVRPLAFASAPELLYCDSCHAGRRRLLDRRDPKALAAWMSKNFVEPLQRKDSKDHDCATCHGDPFDPKILAGWRK